jgi:hypothetical protein
MKPESTGKLHDPKTGGFLLAEFINETAMLEMFVDDLHLLVSRVEILKIRHMSSPWLANAYFLALDWFANIIITGSRRLNPKEKKRAIRTSKTSPQDLSYLAAAVKFFAKYPRGRPGDPTKVPPTAPKQALVFMDAFSKSPMLMELLLNGGFLCGMGEDGVAGGEEGSGYRRSCFAVSSLLFAIQRMTDIGLSFMATPFLATLESLETAIVGATLKQAEAANADLTTAEILLLRRCWEARRYVRLRLCEALRRTELPTTGPISLRIARDGTTVTLRPVRKELPGPFFKTFKTTAAHGVTINHYTYDPPNAAALLQASTFKELAFVMNFDAITQSRAKTRVCGYCGRTYERFYSERPKPQRCTSCGVVHFCDQECLLKAWRTQHKADCAMYKALKEHELKMDNPLEALACNLISKGVEATSIYLETSPLAVGQGDAADEAAETSSMADRSRDLAEKLGLSDAADQMYVPWNIIAKPRASTAAASAGAAGAPHVSKWSWTSTAFAEEVD